jgi:hypothetical protein
VATSEEKEKNPADELPSRFDHRQASLFCAGWTLGSLKYLAQSGAVSITYYETTGRGGIIHGQHKPVSPAFFPAAEGELYPVYFLFQELLSYGNLKIKKTSSSHPRRFSSMLLEEGETKLIALANHNNTRQKIMLPNTVRDPRIWLLDEHTIHALRDGKDIWYNSKDTDSVTLNPYAVMLMLLTSSTSLTK